MIAIVTNTSEVKSVIQYAPFQISINADYTDWNKAFANITDAILVIKKTNSNSDSAFFFQKQWKASFVKEGSKEYPQDWAC